MLPNVERRWNIATAIAAALWLFLMLRLQIADVWDETVGMVFFGDPARPLGEKLTFILTQSLGFWRPLPTLVVATILHLIPDFDVNFRVLRTLNIALVLTGVALLIAAAETWTGKAPARRFVMTIALLFSGSAVITASWYANVWDATVLVLVAGALLLIARGHHLTAGIVIGVSFFCKEATALALPAIFVLFAAGRITFRQALRIGIPATILGAVYFVIRSKIVPFGSAGDVHGFQAEYFLPTVTGLLSSFWLQHMKGSGPGIIGALSMVWFLAALRKPRLVGSVLLFLAAAVIVYWGMFVTWQDGVVVSHLNFLGRLYLVPVALLVFVLAIESRVAFLAVLCLPIVFGATQTFRDHLTFQRTYAQVYSLARQSPQKPLRVHYPEKPLQDPVRELEIGVHPDAPVHIDPRTGAVVRR